MEKTVENAPGNTFGYTYFGLQNGLEYRRKETNFTCKPADVPRNKEWTEAEVEFDKLCDFDSIRKKLQLLIFITRRFKHPRERTKCSDGFHHKCKL